MRKAIHSLTGLVLVLIPFCGGAWLFYVTAFDAGRRDAWLSLIQDRPILGLVFGAVQVLIAVAYVVTFGTSCSRDRYVSFKSESGDVSVSVDAVRDFIQKLNDEFDSIESLTSQVRSVKNKIGIDLNVKVRAGTRIPELSRQLQDRVRESVRDSLGIAEISEIKVKIQKIVGNPLPSKSS